MIFDGQNISSKKRTMNFRKINESKTQNQKFKDGQFINDSEELIEHEIFNENNASFAIIKTNLWTRPSTLMLDTGASISIIADSKVGKNVEIKNRIVKCTA